MSVRHSRGNDAQYYKQQSKDKNLAKNCFFFKDNDEKFPPLKLTINKKKYPRLESIKSELSKKIDLPFGVRGIFTPQGHSPIVSVDDLQNGHCYVCSSYRQRAKGVDINNVYEAPRWFYDKPSSGNREYKSLLQEQELEPINPGPTKRSILRDEKMAYAYNRSHPKKITIIQNNFPQNKHIILINRRTGQSFDQILTDMSGIFPIAVQKLFTTDGRRVRSLVDMLNGPDVLVAAAGTERFQPMTERDTRSEPPYYGSPSRMRSRVTSRMSRTSNMPYPSQGLGVPTRFQQRRERLTKTCGRWKVICTTNELSTAGTTAQVTITVYGHKGNSGPVPLGFPDNISFQSGCRDEFDIDIGQNIGEIYKIRISHDNTGVSPGWFCDEIEMRDLDTNEFLRFVCRRWLSRLEDDTEICREFPAIRRGEPHLQLIRYQVTIYTGDLWNGGTASNVYLTIFGDKGDSGVRQMYVEDNQKAFNKGQVNHFTVEAVSLGRLKKVIVGHDGTVPGDGWFLEKVTVQEPDAKPHEVYHFFCGKWLDEGEDDGKIVRELKVQDEYLEDILEKRNWEIEKWKFDPKKEVSLVSMLTGKALRVKPDGTVDGNGELSDPSSVFIVSSKKPMIRIFASAMNPNFHLVIDNGKVSGQGKGGPHCEFRVHVQNDRSVMLEGARAPMQFITLMENGRLGDSRTFLDKDPAKRFHVYPKGVMRQKGIIILRTSNTQAISVDHDKSVYATGRLNRASHFRVHKVDAGIRMFESMIYPGFYLRVKDGKIDCNGSRTDDSHFLVEKVKDRGHFTLQLNKERGTYVGFTHRGEVRPTMDTGLNNIYIFPETVEVGLSKLQVGPNDSLQPLTDRTTSRRTSRSQKQTPRKIGVQEGDHSILVTTAETLEYGDVSINVFGERGSTGAILLSGPVGSGPSFNSGNSDEFKVNLQKIGKPFKVRLELTPKSQNREPSWKVQKVVLSDISQQDSVTIPFNKWLSRERDDQHLIREMPITKPGREAESLPLVRYEVLVFTGREENSDTSANVFLNMFGDYGDCGKRELRLSDKPVPFQKGQCDKFEVEAVHLGSISKLKISHDETRPNEGWYLDKVVVREGVNANMEFRFDCNKWLDSSIGDRKLERVLLVSDQVMTEKREITPPAIEESS